MKGAFSQRPGATVAMRDKQQWSGVLAAVRFESGV
jgi:hypothetical protein